MKIRLDKAANYDLRSKRAERLVEESVKVAPYSFMTARELVTNLAGN